MHQPFCRTRKLGPLALVLALTRILPCPVGRVLLACPLCACRSLHAAHAADPLKVDAGAVMFPDDANPLGADGFDVDTALTGAELMDPFLASRAHYFRLSFPLSCVLSYLSLCTSFLAVGFFCGGLYLRLEGRRGHASSEQPPPLLSARSGVWRGFPSFFLSVFFLSPFPSCPLRQQPATGSSIVLTC